MTRRSFVAAAVAATGKINDSRGPRFLIAAVTPLERRRQFDDAITKDYLALLAAGGADGVLVLGTTGEFASFAVKERRQILESFARHRGKLSLMAQVGAPNLPDTLELLAHAGACGADAALVLPPFYFKNVPTDGLVRFYEPILTAAKMPVLLYNIPQLSGVPITAELLRRLAEYPRLYGMKDSFSKADAMAGFIRDFPKLKILTGAPGNIERNLKEGGAGAITGNGSALVRETAAIFQAFRNHGDVAAAQARFNEAARAFAGYDGISAQKYALTLKGLPEMYCRPPLVELNAEQRKALAARL